MSQPVKKVNVTVKELMAEKNAELGKHYPGPLRVFGHYTGFAQQLIRLREERGWTQKELGDRCGLSDKTISRLEGGLVEPKWTTVLAIMKGFDLPLDAFVVPDSEVRPPIRRRRGRPSNVFDTLAKLN